MNPTVVMKYLGRMHTRKFAIINQLLDEHRKITDSEQSELDWIHEKLHIISDLISGGWYER